MNAISPVTETSFASDPNCLAERADWLRHRLEGHIEQAHRYRTLAARARRWGNLWMAQSNLENAERHERMAADLERKLA